MKTALIDASSAILLYKSGLLEPLVDTYPVLMAGAVYKELDRSGYPGADTFRMYARQGKMCRIATGSTDITHHPAALLMTALGPGERDTILHHLLGTGHFIIIDDGRGAGFCRKLRLPYINALLFPRILYELRRISRESYREKTDGLIRIGRYSRRVIDYAGSCSRTDLDFFLP